MWTRKDSSLHQKEMLESTLKKVQPNKIENLPRLQPTVISSLHFLTTFNLFTDEESEVGTIKWVENSLTQQ